MNYILDESGNPVLEPDVIKWATWFEANLAKKQVANTVLPNGRHVSTVFLGLNHRFDDSGPPLVFETMVFPAKDSWDELYSDRYCTKAEALEGHAKAVALFSTPEFWS